MGLLTVSGVLRVKQFWPGARSDADTATMDIVGKRAFVFQTNAGRRRVTSAFENAEMVGQFGRTAVIRQSKGSTVRKVSVRLQGLDAPELHYQPQVKGAGGKGVNHPFRQSLGETCADALHAFVSAFGQPEIPCEFLSIVNNPGDVCDVFGRMVGNIVLIIGGSRIDLNHWLLREGWALPGFYNSMTKPEIRALLADHEAAKRDGRGLFSKKIVSTALALFDAQRRERKGPASFKPFSDKGRVNFPKFFRRQAEHHVRAAIGENVPANLRAFIATKSTDIALPRDRFLKLKGSTTGSKTRPEFRSLATFLGVNRYPTGPELVYWENDAKLVKAGTTTEIKNW